MPSLTPDDRAQLLGPVNRCPCCHVARVRHYCRSCDQFFLECACDGEGGHQPPAHRVYRWAPSGIVAIPNFDDL